MKQSKIPESKLERAQSRIVNVAENFEHLKLLGYGRNGTGKTRLGASGPKPLIVDCNERGTLSVRNIPDVKVFSLERWGDIDLIYWFLHKGDHDRETVVVDTVSSLAQLCMKFVLGDEASRDPTKDPNMPSKREWGKVGELMRTEILKFRNLDMNVVFLAQERRGFAEDDEEAPEIFPEVSPSVRSTLTASVDIIGRLYVKEVVVEKGGKKLRKGDYRMMIGPTERFVTKDRSESGLGTTVVLTDKTDALTRIIEKIKNGGENG